MKISYWFLLFLFAFGTVFLMILIVDAPIAATGKPHDQFSTMLHSGSSVVASNTVKLLAYFFGMGIIGIFGFGVAFGARRRERLGPIKPWIFIGVLAYLVVFSLLVFSYWSYAEGQLGGFFGGMPIPTAVMLYGLGSVPLVLSFVYIIKFKDWVLTEEDEARFQELVKRRQNK